MIRTGHRTPHGNADPGKFAERRKRRFIGYIIADENGATSPKRRRAEQRAQRPSLVDPHRFYFDDAFAFQQADAFTRSFRANFMGAGTERRAFRRRGTVMKRDRKYFVFDNDTRMRFAQTFKPRA
jgi:hypothetical protein